MTELTESEAAAAAQAATSREARRHEAPAWPQPTRGGVTDPLVQPVLAMLADLPVTALSEHEAAYILIHDQLHAALDADPVGA